MLRSSKTIDICKAAEKAAVQSQGMMAELVYADVLKVFEKKKNAANKERQFCGFHYIPRRDKCLAYLQDLLWEEQEKLLNVWRNSISWGSAKSKISGVGSTIIQFVQITQIGEIWQKN